MKKRVGECLIHRALPCAGLCCPFGAGGVSLRIGAKPHWQFLARQTGRLMQYAIVLQCVMVIVRNSRA